jgi:hypothetical protein
MRTQFLSILPASLLLLTLGCSSPRPEDVSSGGEISSDRLAKLLEEPDKVFFLDVREPQEISRLGSVRNYVNIPFSQLPARLGEVPRGKVVVTL